MSQFGALVKNNLFQGVAGTVVGLAAGWAIICAVSTIREKISAPLGVPSQTNKAIEDALSSDYFKVSLSLQGAPRAVNSLEVSPSIISSGLAAAIMSQQDFVLEKAQQCAQAVADKNQFKVPLKKHPVENFTSKDVVHPAVNTQKSKDPSADLKNLMPGSNMPSAPKSEVPAKEPIEGYFKAQSGRLVDDDNLFVMKTSYSYFCGGARPSEGSVVLTYSKKANKPVQLAKLLNVIEDEPTPAVAAISTCSRSAVSPSSKSDCGFTGASNREDSKEDSRTLAEKLLLEGETRTDEQLKKEYPVLDVFANGLSSSSEKIVPVLSKQFMSSLLIHNLTIASEKEGDPCFASFKESLESLDDADAPSLFYFNDARFILTPSYISVGFDNRDSLKACYAAMTFPQRKLKNFVNVTYAKEMGLDFLVADRSVTNLEP